MTAAAMTARVKVSSGDAPPIHGSRASLTRKAVGYWLKAGERAFISELLKIEPAIKVARDLGREFWRMVRERDGEALDDWLAQVAASGLIEFKNFAKGLRADEAAVRAALTYEWSNGMTEGHINRLKLIKRQMYGRANHDLLRARVLHAA